MARKKLQKINFVDLEATCYDENKFPEGEFQEIIEIGICQLDIKSLEIEKKTGILVKPKTSTISQYCTDITGYTQDVIDRKGVSFERAIEMIMNHYKTKKYEWMSWGNFDRRMFDYQCERESVKYPFYKSHTNFKYIFSLLTHQTLQRNVSAALDFVGLKFDGTPHKGVDDAYNIARIYVEVLKEIRSKTKWNTLIEQYYVPEILPTN